jgi:Cu-Zn family superoxide dismutase
MRETEAPFMRLRTTAFLGAVLIALGGAAAALTARQMTMGAPRGHADIKGEGITGTADLREVDAQTAGAHEMKFMTGAKAVEVTVTVTGLKPGPHGVHLHQFGKCEAPDFASAGGHFDPGPSGNVDPDANHPFHMGDLANLVADTTGKGTLKITTSRVTLGDGPLSVFDPDGTAIIIHANPDQGVTGQPKSGVSGGPRVACGVITK